jgi:hypothetical protein
MIAWGLSTGQWTVPELIAKLSKPQPGFPNGYEWVAVEFDDANTQDVNRTAFPDILAQARAVGKQAGPWFTDGGNVYLTPGDADFTIAEQEGPGDYQGIVYCESNGLIPPVSKGVCTNFSTIGYAEASFFVQHEWTCLPEAYMNEVPAATPSGVNNIARSLGWPTSQPVAGVYPTPIAPNPRALYAPWSDWPLIDYLGEYVLDLPFSQQAADAWLTRRRDRRLRKRTTLAT